MWRTYIQLTDVESVFRSLKSELGLRPVFHPLETRCKAHLWISVLAYQCVQFLRHELKAKGIHASWTTLREQLHRHHRISARYQRQDGAFVHIKKNQETPMDVQAIYDALGIQPIKTTKRTFYSNQL
jgi:transposase